MFPSDGIDFYSKQIFFSWVWFPSTKLVPVHHVHTAWDCGCNEWVKVTDVNAEGRDPLEMKVEHDNGEKRERNVTLVLNAQMEGIDHEYFRVPNLAKHACIVLEENKQFVINPLRLSWNQFQWRHSFSSLPSNRIP